MENQNKLNFQLHRISAIMLPLPEFLPEHLKLTKSETPRGLNCGKPKELNLNPILFRVLGSGFGGKCCKVTLPRTNI